MNSDMQRRSVQTAAMVDLGEATKPKTDPISFALNFINFYSKPAKQEEAQPIAESKLADALKVSDKD